MTTPIQIYLTVRGGTAAVEWYTKTWGAAEEMKQMADDGKRLLHATLSLFGGQIMLSDEFPEFGTDVAAPPTQNGTTATVHVNLADRGAVDKAFAAAKTGGATITMPQAEMFWGAYYGRLMDPFGHSWSFAAD